MYHPYVVAVLAGRERGAAARLHFHHVSDLPPQARDKLTGLNAPRALFTVVLRVPRT